CGAGGAAGTPAASGVRAYLEALKRDDPQAAYRLLSEEAKQAVTYEEFASRWQRSQTERAYQVRALEEGLRGDEDLGERASVRYRDGKTVGLSREGGNWRLEPGLVSNTHAGGARDAIKILA